MNVCFLRFNIVLLVACLALGTGCSSLGKKKATLFRVHMEATAPIIPDRTVTAEIGRTGLIVLTMEKLPILDEGNVAKASVARAKNEFVIIVEFDRHGSWVLEQYTTTGRGLHMGIFSQFGANRWLAAPEINRTIKDGVLRFTPDATLAESERLVKGINAIAQKAQKNNP